MMRRTWNFLLFSYNIGGWVWAYGHSEPYLTPEARIAIIVVGVIWLYHTIKSRVRPTEPGTGRRLLERGLNICFNIFIPAALLLFFETCVDKDITGRTLPADLRSAYVALLILLVTNLIYEVQHTLQSRRLKAASRTVASD